MRDIQFAFRTFSRAPLTAFTIVATVSIGLGVVAVLYTILNTFLFRIDRVPNINEMYAVQRPQLADGSQGLFPRQYFDALRAQTTAFRDAYAAMAERDVRVDGRMSAVTLVTGNFFEVVGVQTRLGRGLRPDDDLASGGNNVIVLSDKGWDRRFNRDPNVIGRTVLVGGDPFEIVGVAPEGFRGLEVSGPDFWAPLSTLPKFLPSAQDRDAVVNVEIIGRLRPGVSAASARSQLAAWDSNQPGAPADRRTTNIALVPRRGTIPQPMEALAVFTPLFLAFGLILLIGCANVANLLLARGVARQREIGVRLSLGASRRRIVVQLLTESLILGLIAAVGGYLVSRVALQGTVYWTLRTMPVDFGDVNINVPASDWRVALFLVVGAVAATAFFALMPALQSTRIDPVRSLRGELVKDARPGRARNVLIAVQVFASALLLICTAIFLRSALASSQFDPGLRTADTVLIEINNEPKRTALLQAIATESTIATYAGVRPVVLAPALRGLADTGSGKTPVAYKFVSAPYFDVLGIPIVSGRVFTGAERDEDSVAIVSESIARSLWPNGSAVGQTLRLEPDLEASPQPNNAPPVPARTVTIVGISRDVRGFRITDANEPGFFLPTSLDAAQTSIVARVKGDSELARQTLVEHLTRVDPNLGMLVTMRTVARLETYFLQVAFWVSLILGGLALLLTVSGLFSVLSYLVEQRRKEIGVRMALGASSRDVTALIVKQTSRPVLIGLIGGTGLAASLAAALLATEVGAFIAEVVHVADPIAYAASLLVILAACAGAASIPAARAARLDPMRTLRQD